MTTFAILDEFNAELLELNGGTNIEDGSLTLVAEGFSFENKIIENTFLAGSSKLGDTRIMAREATLAMSRAYDNPTTYRNKVNTLIQYLKAGTYLHDKENDMRIPYAVDSFNVSYDGGSFRHSSEDSISLIFLRPFWENVTELSFGPKSIPASSITDEAFTNPGFIEIFPRFEINAVAAVTDFSITVVETFNSISVLDNLFGTTGYEDIEVDCGRGTVTLGLLDRINSIDEGTGFFSIPYGASTLRFFANDAITVTMYYRGRYYI